MKKYTKLKKLTLNKEEIANLTNEEMVNLIGGAKETYINPETGGYCTQGGCDDPGATDECTFACPSDPETGCDDTVVTQTFSYVDLCFSDANCTYTNCTGGCPNTYGDATCTCLC